MRWMLVERVAESCRAPLNYIAHKLYGMCVGGGGVRLGLIVHCYLPIRDCNS